MIGQDDRALRAFFGKAVRPRIEISLADVRLEAQKMAGKLSISGIQPKLSMRLKGEVLEPVQREGQYILKPQTQEFPELPQNEYLCMQLGRMFELDTAESLLVELADGSPAYLVKRFDRQRRGRRLVKLACEDMQQLLGGPDKYAGSHEQMAKVIKEHCRFAPLELQRLYERSVFNFAIGNGDAHRKNFSLLTSEDGTVALSPVYDLVSSRVVIPGEREEMALALNGRRNKMRREDFLSFAESIGVKPDFAELRIREMAGLGEEMRETIRRSKLSKGLQERFEEVVGERLERLG